MSYTRVYLNATIGEATEPGARIISDPADEPLAEIVVDQAAAVVTKDAEWCRNVAAAFARAAVLLDEANALRGQS